MIGFFPLKTSLSISLWDEKPLRKQPHCMYKYHKFQEQQKFVIILTKKMFRLEMGRIHCLLDKQTDKHETTLTKFPQSLY